MDILVYGAGAIGGFLGGRLLSSGQQVTLLERPEMAEIINAKGLVVSEAGRTLSLRPPAVASLQEAFAGGRAYDLIIMALKTYDLSSVIEPLAAVCPITTSLLTMENGIGVEDPFIDRFGPGRIIAGSLTTPVSKTDITSLVVERSDRGLGLAPTSAGQDISRWVNMFEEAGITTVSLGDWESMKWSKALLNMVGNASSAILDLPPGEIYQDPQMFTLETRMLQETLAVMAAKDLRVVNLPGSPASSLATAVKWVPRFLLKPILSKIVAGGRGEKMPSFYIDLISGRGMSEVIYHNGAVAAAGEALGINTPVNKALNDILLKLTSGELDRQLYKGNSQLLLNAVQKFE